MATPRLERRPGVRSAGVGRVFLEDWGLDSAIQRTIADGASIVNVGGYSGALQQQFLPGTGGSDKNFALYTSNITARFAGLTLSSISGFGIYTQRQLSDYTPFYGGPNNITSLIYPGNLGAGDVDDLNTRKFTQELRLSSTVGMFDWLLGAFYTHEIYDPTSQTVYAANLATGAPVQAPFWAFVTSDSFAESSIFADGTVHFTDRFSVQVGGRESWDHQGSGITTASGPVQTLFQSPNPEVTPVLAGTTDAFTYLLTPQYKFSESLMAYIRLASGYRRGINGPSIPGFPPIPASFGAYKTHNYEFGFKGDALDHKLSFDASLYYIDWRKISQILSPSPARYSRILVMAIGHR